MRVRIKVKYFQVTAFQEGKQAPLCTNGEIINPTSAREGGVSETASGCSYFQLCAENFFCLFFFSKLTSSMSSFAEYQR